MSEEKKKQYPTPPKETTGLYFENEDEEKLDIRTKDYENGNKIKEVKLKNGRVAIIRKLKGRDMVETRKRIQNDNSLDFETTNMAVAITFDGKTEPPEYFLDDLYQDEYSRLLVAYGSLNL